MSIIRNIAVGSIIQILSLPTSLLAVEHQPARPAPSLGDPPKLGEIPRLSFPALSSAESDRIGLVVDISNRQQARAFYSSVYLGSTAIEANWSGNIATCVAGGTAESYKQRILDRINYYRAVAGVPADISLIPGFNGKSQAGALIMSANGALSHTPPATWDCWSADGNEAAGKSNLSLGSSGPDAVQGYIRDNGSNNQAVGHRRWILYPQTREMGTGDITPATSDEAESNDLWVIDSHYWDDRPGTRDNFVAWPPKGFVPYQTVYPRWSFSYPGADFSAAQVNMTNGGSQVGLTVHPVQTGFGENTIVWVPDGVDPDSFDAAWPKPPEDKNYRVNLTNVLIDNQPQAFQYDITIFDPDTAATDEELPLISGDGAIPTNTVSSYHFTPISFADVHQVLTSSLMDFSQVLDAETVNPLIQDQTEPGYPLIQSQIAKSGSSAFHLAHPTAQTQMFGIDAAFYLGVDSQLLFESRLTNATSTQSSRVEISFNGGSHWQILYEQAGSGPGGESDFVRRTIDLASHAGRAAKFRFVYHFDQGSYYGGTSAGNGWYLDDIQLTGAQEIVDGELSVLNGSSSFDLLPAAEGSFLLLVRGQPWPGFTGMEWGPGKIVKALHPTTDNDQDLMIDLWELDHALDPDNPADAALDSDGDGASNLAEHDAGTDPQNPESYPEPAGGGQPPALLIMPWLDLLLSTTNQTLYPKHQT